MGARFVCILTLENTIFPDIGLVYMKIMTRSWAMTTRENMASG